MASHAGIDRRAHGIGVGYDWYSILTSVKRKKRMSEREKESESEREKERDTDREIGELER